MVTTPQPAPQASNDTVESVQSLIATVVVAVFAITFIIQAFQIPSPSMETTLLVGDYLLVDKLRYGDTRLAGWFLPYRAVKRGDIVVFRYPVNPAQHFVKRVIGLPGDRLRLRNKRVLINGVPLEESYVRFLPGPPDPYRDDFPRLGAIAPSVDATWWQEFPKLVRNGELVVPEDHYFVMGDNRDNSSDSRYWGFVPRDNIIGRPLLIYWSLRGSEGDLPAGASVNDKIFHFAYVASHIFQMTRWDRTLRRVR
jgi:signal peptidase I